MMSRRSHRTSRIRRAGLIRRAAALLVMITLVPVCTFAFPCPASADSGHPVVVSLGDSFSSGEGVEPFYHQRDEHDENNQDWLAHRSEKCWSGKLYVTTADGEDVYLSEVRDGGEKASWYFVASSGAETRHLRKEKQEKTFTKKVYNFLTGSHYELVTTHLPEQLEVFDQIPEGETVDYVTITIGGNDAGFVPMLTRAITESSLLEPNKINDIFDELWANYEDHIRNDLIEAYTDIEAAAGKQAKIIVAGYPLLLAPGDHSEIGINSHETKVINENTHLFNSKIEGVVNELREKKGMNIYFVSVEEEFEGHGAYSLDPYINGAEIGAKSQDINQEDMISSYSIHPNDKGTSAYARAVQKKIDELELGNRGGDDIRRDIALVIDTSGSMAGEPIEQVKLATVRFTEAVAGTKSKVGLISFKYYSNVEQKLTQKPGLINKAVERVSAFGGTNMGEGLVDAGTMMYWSDAERKIIVLMSDGLPNIGKDPDEIIAEADRLKKKGIYIYTLGFFSGVSPSEKAEAQHLLEQIASEGCHYEIADAADLQFFFGDVADQINGVRYNYIRIACPVDVTVTYNGETLSSADTDKRARTSFGTLTFENAYTGQAGTYQEGDSENGGTYSYDGEYDEANVDAVKILRLREGPDYDIQITGTGDGKMDYVIGFVDDNGEYSDMRYFDAIEVCADTEISTKAKVSDTTMMSVDYDGDGVVDKSYRAEASSHAELVDNSTVVYLVMIVFAALIAALLLLCFAIYLRKNAYKGAKKTRS